MYLDIYNREHGDLPEKIILFETQVILLGGFYTHNEMNPSWGGKYACIGVVVKYSGDDGHLPYQVRWENGAHNNYASEELRIHSANMGGDNPNRAFKRRIKHEAS